jgi:hypothetical protein
MGGVQPRVGAIIPRVSCLFALACTVVMGMSLMAVLLIQGLCSAGSGSWQQYAAGRT